MNTAEVIKKYSEIEYIYTKGLEDHPNASNNAYMEGYRNAIRHILEDLKTAERS